MKPHTLKVSTLAYYQLTKPGIIRGNLITAAAGFLLASKGHINVVLFLVVLTGMSLVIASGCVFNNYIDRDIDKLMSRTKKRALAVRLLPARNAIIFACMLGVLGFFTLIRFTNLLTALIGLVGFIDYVVLYGIFKRKSVHGTIVGSISGAMPPVAGYTAVTNRFDAAAAILFFVLVLWQMPHFYAIAMYRFDDYKRAKIPVLPVVKGMHATKIQILAYIAAFMATASLLTFFGFTGYIYLLVVMLLGLLWLKKGIQGFKQKDDQKWARKMFHFSLLVITILCLAISFGNFLP